MSQREINRIAALERKVAELEKLVAALLKPRKAA
jgi:hypothetical protein